MGNRPQDRQKMIDALMRNSDGKLDRGSIESAMDGDPNALMSKLNDADKAKIQRLLNDKSALQKLLSSDAAQQMMKKFSGNGK